MSISSLRKAKEKKVVEISSILKNASSLVIAEYRGLKVSEIEALRQELKNNGTKAKVYKNRLVKLAVDQQKDLEKLKSFLIGPNIFVFGAEDDLAPAKIVAKFAKKHPHIVIKGGIYENAVVNAEEVQKIATLPSYEEALTILASSLLSPIRQIGVGLKMLVDENKILEN
ncbi:50S ribosomal protein L10 [Mycoplasma iguanae]|uniref:Large ribosomal subunit protein uL10 n=1 Tax=Mycoplasma iguanae TaxID=292461 RepID=A0ABY5RA35_9MOLU|nr:50S ribosomal protein L10 [Mycoplasma iguanae]UVD81480.1 50S ribosomal protein L10 [Mycoplasma iguanae]